jgi:hypothetical protein
MFAASVKSHGDWCCLAFPAALVVFDAIMVSR